jgi:hypothetical protein
VEPGVPGSASPVKVSSGAAGVVFPIILAGGFHGGSGTVTGHIVTTKTTS